MTLPATDDDAWDGEALPVAFREGPTHRIQTKHSNINGNGLNASKHNGVEGPSYSDSPEPLLESVLPAADGAPGESDSLLPDDYQGYPPDAPSGFDVGAPVDFRPSLHVPYRASAEVASEPSWPEPVDVASKSYVGLPLRLEWVPDAIAAHISDVAYRTGFDPGLILCGDLAACSGVADDAFRVASLLNDLEFLERPCVWTLAVAHSGAGKTHALMQGIRPVEAIDREIIAHNAARTLQYQFDMEKHAEARKAAVKNRDISPPAEPEAPPQEEIYCNAGTLQGVRMALKNTPRGILWFRDEWSGMIGEFDRFNNGSGDRAEVLEMYNGGQKKTRLASAPIVVPNLSAVLCGGITPSAILQFAGPGKLQDDGLLQRFLICMGRRQSDEHDVAANPEALSGYVRVLKNLRAMSCAGPSIKMSPEAYKVRQSFMESQKALESDESLPSPMRSQLGKWQGLFARLCLLYHLIDLASHGQWPGDKEQVSGDTAQKVSNLLLLWQYSHLEEFWLDMMTTGGGYSFVQRVANYILRFKLLTVNHNRHIVGPHHNGWTKLCFNDQRDALQRLENAGWWLPDSAKKNRQGFPSSWVVNPAVHTKFTVRAAESGAERDRIRAELQRLRARAADERTAGSDD